jgi:hypothetical protein
MERHRTATVLADDQIAMLRNKPLGTRARTLLVLIGEAAVIGVDRPMTPLGNDGEIAEFVPLPARYRRSQRNHPRLSRGITLVRGMIKALNPAKYW